jgi:hypothetical protein
MEVGIIFKEPEVLPPGKEPTVLGGSHRNSGHFGEEGSLLLLQGIEPKFLRRPALIPSKLSPLSDKFLMSY